MDNLIYPKYGDDSKTENNYNNESGEDDSNNDDKKKGPPANNGDAKKHGNDNHNDAIDNRIDELKKDDSVTDIRKNQQVDVDGNNVGKNRPDIQYNKDGCHYCVEYDHVPSNGTRHGEVIRGNDPNTNVEINTL